MRYNCGIYKIENIVTGDFYIGQSINLKKRKYQHFHELNKNKHINKFLQNSYNKYKRKNFQFSILLYSDQDNLTFYEQLLVDNLSPTFNLCLKCVDTIKGTKIKSQALTRIKNLKHKNYLSYINKNCQFNSNFGTNFVLGKFPKILIKGKNIYKYNIFKQSYPVSFYPFTLLMLYIYKNKIKNKKHSKIILKYFKKYKKSYVYNSFEQIYMKTIFRDEYPTSNFIKKVFKNIKIKENDSSIFIYVNRSYFKHVYIIYF